MDERIHTTREGVIYIINQLYSGLDDRWCLTEDELIRRINSDIYKNYKKKYLRLLNKLVIYKTLKEKN